MRRLAALALLAAACSGPEPPPVPEADLVLVTASGLREDRVGIYGYSENVTPALDLLAAGGAIFLEARTPWPEIGRAAAAALTGMDPSRATAVREGPALLAAAPLAERLRAHGYRTVAATDHPALTEATGFARGFDEFAEHWDDPGEFEGAFPDSPFFAWLHFSLDGPADDYDARVAALDESVRRLLAPISKRTVVIVAGLHGRSFGERGTPEDAPMTLFDEMLRIPLVVAVLGEPGPPFPPGTRFAGMVSLADVPATAWELMGGASEETSLVPALRGRDPRPRRRLHAASDSGATAILDGRLKLLRIPLPGRDDAVFAAYALDRDPGETDNRYHLAAQSIEPLRAELETRRIQSIAWSREAERDAPAGALPPDLLEAWERRR